MPEPGGSGAHCGTLSIMCCRCRRCGMPRRARISCSGCRAIFMPLLVLPLVLSTAAAGHVAYSVLGSMLLAASTPAAPGGGLTLCIFTVTMLLAYDLSDYVYHRLQHQVPILWELHKVAPLRSGHGRGDEGPDPPARSIMNSWWDGRSRAWFTASGCFRARPGWRSPSSASTSTCCATSC